LLSSLVVEPDFITITPSQDYLPKLSLDPEGGNPEKGERGDSHENAYERDWGVTF
jgi:hypothetical protein